MEVEIVKPLNDKREYKRIVLSNSLEVLLISDPETDKAAAAMDVSIGAFSDPDGLEGLAHFLEHMLFYASEKYPLEDSYMKYLTEHGGKSNAFTGSEHTNFHFDVNADYFEEALDRFAQFFISPLMSANATSREINAVDSENKKNVLVDGWRLNQLQKHLSSVDHPYHKFSTGNLETLDVRPRERGLDVRQELLKFYSDHYSANLMHLVVYGKESIDKLKMMVDSRFSAIKNTQKTCPYFMGEPCHDEHLQILVKCVPVKEKHTLSILWPVTPELKFYKEGPSRYLGHLIGHEAEGSLFSLLKSLGWASSLSAGETESSFEYEFFGIIIELTDAGSDHMEDIVEFIFQYLQILRKRGVAEWIFEEVKAICTIKFNYRDKISPINYVMDIASNARVYPPQDWLVGSSIPSTFNPGLIKEILEQLIPERARIFWMSKKFEGKTTETERWYGTQFSVMKIGEYLLERWRCSKPDDRLNLPLPNMFIPTDLSIKEVEEKVGHPLLLQKTSFSRLWYKADTLFLLPKAVVKLDFHCPESNQSPEAELLTHIFTKLLEDCLNEYTYYAEIAGLNYSLGHTATGFQVTVVGYNDKMRILLDKVLEKIQQFEVKQDRFAVIKENILKKYVNFKFQQPYQQAFYYSSLLLEHRMWQRDEFLEVLPHLEAKDLTGFAPRILSRMFIECYVAGNVTPNEAKLLIQHIEDSFFNGGQALSKPLFPSQYVEARIVRIDSGSSYYYPIQGLNAKDENSALLHYIQLEQDDSKVNVLLELFVLSAKQAAFHQLRSVEQLGYITALMTRNDCGVRGSQFIIQSTVKDPAQLDSRVEAFLEMFERKLHEQSDEEFQTNVKALIEIKLEKFKNLREESSFYWREIEDGTLNFERKSKEVALLKSLSKQDFIDFYESHIKFSSPNRRKLSLQVYGSCHAEAYNLVKASSVSVKQHGTVNTIDSKEYNDIHQSTNSNMNVSSSNDTVRDVEIEQDTRNAKLIDNIHTFKRSQGLFGSLKNGVRCAD
eukprot:TRINITY_DN9512_c0_g2_i7.p1 TRINITY_DN9512_c0_g2~~TRINITY_DN9512_c0_g2_i7.p1  ORF type:complete len:1006 (+),score=221.01 TRINITY_DN9512_c0_g2_i7:195-3212(+)